MKAKANYGLGLSVAYVFGFFMLATFLEEIPRIPILRGALVSLLVFAIMRIGYEFLRIDK